MSGISDRDIRARTGVQVCPVPMGFVATFAFVGRVEPGSGSCRHRSKVRAILVVAESYPGGVAVF